MHEVLVNRLGGLSLPTKSVVRLTYRPDMTLDVYRGRKTTMQQYNVYTVLHSRLTGFDALLIDRVAYYKFAVILRFLCTRKCPEASSLKHVVFM